MKCSNTPRTALPVTRLPASGPPSHALVHRYNSIIQGKSSSNDFVHLHDIDRRLSAFEPRYEQTAAPFAWKFTRHDLALLLKNFADKLQSDSSVATVSQRGVGGQPREAARSIRGSRLGPRGGPRRGELIQ